MKSRNVFKYSDLTDYLRDTAAHRFGCGLSTGGLARAAKALGYSSPRTLAMVLKGQRQASEKMILQFAQLENLSPQEFYHLEALRWKNRQESAQSAAEAQQSSSKSLAPAYLENTCLDKPQALQLGSDRFHGMTNWYLFVIKHILESSVTRSSLKKHGENPFLESEIVAALRNKVTNEEVRFALNRLQEKGFVKQNSDLSWITNSVEFDFPKLGSAEARRFHEQMIRRALEALKEQSPESREFQSLTINVDPSKIQEAKIYLQSVMQDFSRRFDSSHSAHVFQLNTQFFEHTRNDNETAIHQEMKNKNTVNNSAK